MSNYWVFVLMIRPLLPWNRHGWEIMSWATVNHNQYTPIFSWKGIADCLLCSHAWNDRFQYSATKLRWSVSAFLQQHLIRTPKSVNCTCKIYTPAALKVENVSLVAADRIGRCTSTCCLGPSVNPTSAVGMKSRPARQNVSFVCSLQK